MIPRLAKATRATLEALHQQSTVFKVRQHETTPGLGEFGSRINSMALLDLHHWPGGIS